MPKAWPRPSRSAGSRTALAALALCVAMGGAVQASIGSVEVVPPNPTEQDSVRIRADGWFYDGCWSVSGFGCGWADPQEILFDIYGVDVAGPGDCCTQIVIPYCHECDYGPLDAGHYLVTVTEYHDSLRDPLPDVWVLEFDVVPDTEVQHLSWGRIRALYR
jgi:hypothetical protein